MISGFAEDVIVFFRICPVENLAHPKRKEVGFVGVSESANPWYFPDSVFCPTF